MEKHLYKKPLTEVVEMELEAMMAASNPAQVTTEGTGLINLDNPVRDGNANTSAVAKSSDIWDFDEE